MFENLKMFNVLKSKRFDPTEVYLSTLILDLFYGTVSPPGLFCLRHALRLFPCNFDSGKYSLSCLQHQSEGSLLTFKVYSNLNIIVI